jgi:hypothetical protein
MDNALIIRVRGRLIDLFYPSIFEGQFPDSERMILKWEYLSKYQNDSGSFACNKLRFIISVIPGLSPVRSLMNEPWYPGWSISRKDTLHLSLDKFYGEGYRISPNSISINKIQ